MLSSTFLCQNPGSIRHRRLMTHVLTMATLKISHPITILVQMISDDELVHAETSLTSSLPYARLARMLTRTKEQA